MELTTILAIAAAITVAGFVQGYAGFGFGIVAMALLAFLPVDLERAAAVATCVGVFQVGVLFLISRRRYGVAWRPVGLILVGTAAGIPLGYAFIVAFGDAPVFGLCLGLVLLGFAGQGLFALWRAVRPRRWPTWLGVPVGLASGFLGGAFVSGGPPVVLYLSSRVEDPRAAKASIQLVFLVGMVIRLGAIGGGPVGFDSDLLVAMGVAVAPVLVAIVIGHRLSQRAGIAPFRLVIFLLIAVAGLALLLRHGGDLLRPPAQPAVEAPGGKAP